MEDKRLWTMREMLGECAPVRSWAERCVIRAMESQIAGLEEDAEEWWRAARTCDREL